MINSFVLVCQHMLRRTLSVWAEGREGGRENEAPIMAEKSTLIECSARSRRDRCRHPITAMLGVHTSLSLGAAESRDCINGGGGGGGGGLPIAALFKEPIWRCSLVRAKVGADREGRLHRSSPFTPPGNCISAGTAWQFNSIAKINY